MADGATISDQDLFGGSAAPVAPEVANPTPVQGGMSYDQHYGIQRNPDGSIKDITNLFGSGHADQGEIASFQSAFPEDIANKGKGAQGGAGTGSAPPGQLSDAQLFTDLNATPTGTQTPSMAAATAVAKAKVQDLGIGQSGTGGPMGAFANGMFFGLQPDIIAGGAYVRTAINNALNRLKGQTPNYSASEAFQASEDVARQAQQSYSQTHPVANALAGVAGGLANPTTYLGGEYLAGAPTALSALGRGAQLGAATGAVQGFGEAGGNLYQRAIGTAQGAATGFATGGALSGASGLVSNALRNTDISAARTLADQALTRTGIDPASLPDQTNNAINAYLAQGRNPTDSAFAGVADTLPTRTPMSVGQMSADPALQWTENQALRGGSGTGATIAAKSFREGQEGALRENVQNIGTALAGTPVQSGEGGVRLSAALNARRDQAASEVNEAYEAARAAPGATLPAEHAADVVKNVRYGLQDYDPRNIPKVTREVRNLEQALSEPPRVAAAEPKVGITKGVGNPPKGVPVSEADLSKYSPQARAALEKALNRENEAPGADVRAIFDARARLVKLTQDNDRVSAGAARRAIKQLDQAIDDAVSQSLFTGDRRAVDLWREAIGKRRILGRLFEGDDLIDKLTDRVERGGEHNVLRVDPIDATNYILGRQGLAGLGRANSTRDIKRLGDMLGRDSAAWKGLKGEVFDRLAQGGEGPSVAGAPTFSGAKFASNWRAAQQKYGPVIDQMFTPEERGLIDRFAVTAERITKPVPGGDNPSNTAVSLAALAKGMKRLPFVALKSLPFIDHMADSLEAANNARIIRAATTGAKPRFTPTGGATIAHALGYAASNQAQRSALEGLHH